MVELTKQIIDTQDTTKVEIVSAIFDVGRNENDKDSIAYALDLCRANMDMLVQGDSEDRESLEIYHKLYYEILLHMSRYDFDSYLLYVEKKRPPKERFYQPRRERLLPVVVALQKLTDNELDELFLSMPPRVGKTTLIIFFYSWIMGRFPEKSNLYSAFSDTITTAFYNGVLEILTDDYTYCWKDVFPLVGVAGTNASLETIDMQRKKHYPTLTSRSLYGTLNGACDCSGIQCGDDLIGGIEEALKQDRMMSAWYKVDNNFLPRAKESAKMLWIGTRWSIVDPIGLRIDTVTNSKEFADVRYEIITLPALDENDESNFDYDYGVGFSSTYYRQRRASYEKRDDIASWNAQYMGEPIERQGTLFNASDMNYYNGQLPDAVPDRIFAYCDIAFGGGDYTSFPVAYQYGESIYIHDVVFNQGDKKITEPKVVDAIVRNGVTHADFEYNNGGEAYSLEVDKMLKDREYYCHITGHKANTHTSKVTRIFDNAPVIKEYYFRDQNCRDKEYEQFMGNIFSFVIEGKNKHDDAPDSLAGLTYMNRHFVEHNAVVLQRFF